MAKKQKKMVRVEMKYLEKLNKQAENNRWPFLTDLYSVIQVL